MDIINYSEMRFLVVEDQRPFLVMLRGLLNTMGAQSVVVAQNAETALNLCRKEKFDFVVSDIHLGADKKNGLELAEELRSRRLVKPTTVILVISADSARELVIGSVEREPDDYLIKPFSQIQLKTRLNRAYHRRVELEPIYRLIAKHNDSEAVQACLELLKKPLHYRQHCLKLLSELYLRIGDGKSAIELTQRIVNERSVKWAQTNLAKAFVVDKQFDQAKSLAGTLLKSNRFNVDAYDVIANSLRQTGEAEKALDYIKKAIEIAPLSLERQYHATQIARESRDFIFAKDRCLSIWQLSKRSMHRDVTHLCNYIRSILDVAEHSDDKKLRNRFQQEALITLQRNRNDEVFSRSEQPFEFTLYENLVHSRISVLDGKTLAAKQLLEETQIAIEERYPEFPMKLAPDSLKVMNDIGDFEDAAVLSAQIAQSEDAHDPHIAYLLSSEEKQQASRLEAYKTHNKKGIEAYREGKFEMALNAFYNAQTFAPVNIGVALNLMQCLLKLMEMQRKPETKLVDQSREVYKLLNAMPLRQQHQKKWAELAPQVAPFLEKSS
ncbi:response regulator [Alteromonas oceanisediminis]|uniref:response regulator n=1 Tax=Alteromonas oceanisediminis TaxID=2836180 RepID=UPI001BD9ED7B|nr:response regulator [Alteromonas oceanisediminis]MBT0587185.1 response regulator [Alteromonas oceanisediminis]